MHFSFFLALKYLKPKRSFTSVVTVVSILGVLLGVAILVIVMSVMRGFDDMWREKILSFKPHLTVYADAGLIVEPERVADRLEQVPGIVAASPSLETQVLMEHARRIAAPVVVGVDPGRARRLSMVEDNLVSGVFDLDGDGLVLGLDLAAELGLRVGDRALLYSPLSLIDPEVLYLPEELEVRGIFDMGMRDFDRGFVLTSLTVARDLMGLREGAVSIHLTTENPFLFDRYRRMAGEALGAGYRVQTWQEADQVLFAALSHEKNMMFILLVFITIVAIFCVTNTLIVITVHKTHEIGLLKALGFSPGQILRAFVWHGWIQCLCGTLLGIGTGLLVLQNLPGIVRALTRFDVEVFPKAIYGLSEIPWRVSTPELARIALVVMIFCTLASLLPAWRASRLDPVEALRHE